jgi:prepilin-type N-terminal cleavage/methylation domain-containing protein
MNSPNPNSRSRPQAGFSLLEVLVAVGLMSIVVLALYSMFDQTQKALRQNAGQTDISEAGRAAMELIVRDVEKAWAAKIPAVTNNGVVLPAVNNLVIRRVYPANQLREFGDDYSRDTTFHELFLLSRPDSGSNPGLGLFVAEENNPLLRVEDQVGTLYRYEVPPDSPVYGIDGKDLFETVASVSPQTLQRPGTARWTFRNFWSQFDGPTALVRTNASRLIDGVVFFRVFAYGPNGQILDRSTVFTNNVPADVVPYAETGPGIENLTTFGNAALPSAVEVELGILPQRLFTQFRSLPDQLKTNFLSRNFANILVFRQRIALRTALQ